MRELGQFQISRPAFDEEGIEIFAIAVDPPDKLTEAKRKSNATFPFVQDRDGALMDLFGLRHVGGHPMKTADIARPALILIDRNGDVLWSDLAQNYRVRPTPEQTLKAIRSSL